MKDEPVIISEDTLDRNRHILRKGRLEFMGGPVVYEQDGLDNNNRKCMYSPSEIGEDQIVKDLGMDIQEP
jgi:hypothetical protein